MTIRHVVNHDDLCGAKPKPELSQLEETMRSTTTIKYLPEGYLRRNGQPAEQAATSSGGTYGLYHAPPPPLPMSKQQEEKHQCRQLPAEPLQVGRLPPATRSSFEPSSSQYQTTQQPSQPRPLYAQVASRPPHLPPYPSSCISPLQQTPSATRATSFDNTVLVAPPWQQQPPNQEQHQEQQ